MKNKRSLKLLILLCWPAFSFAQTASDILERAVKIDNTNELRLKFEKSAINYKTVAGRKTSYVSLDDSLYFLTSNKVPVFIETVNPLNFSVASSLSYSADAISKAQDAAFLTLIKLIKAPGAPPDAASAVAPGGAPALAHVAVVAPAVRPFRNIQREIEALQKRLTNNNKKLIAEQFTILKNITFDNASTIQPTLDGVLTFSDRLSSVYKTYQDSLTKIRIDLDGYTSPPYPFTEVTLGKHMFQQDTVALSASITTQLKWLANLLAAHKLVSEAFSNAVKSDDELLTKVDEVVNNSGKIANLAVTVNKDGMKLTPGNDIVPEDKKAASSRTIKFRKFNRFVFEVAAGVAYTDIDFPKFGTTTDAAGNTVVSDAGKDSFRKFNLTAMFNWNYYIQNSSIHPFFQLGVGANSQYPTLFSGVGLRFNSNASSHFAISGGFASTWVKTLDKLKIGDTVTGTADIDKDITYEFHFPLKPYIGLQYNF